MATDILIHEPFTNGDFTVGFSDEQHMKHVLLSSPGHFKNAPLIGVGIREQLNGPLTPKLIEDLERQIKLHLEADGAKDVRAVIDPVTQKVSINGSY